MRKKYWIDLFCGAGGVSCGIHNAGQKVIACVNHDENAIKSHNANFPGTLHFTEDIRTLNLSPLIQIVADIRKNDPNAIICLWASLECTHFSNAKGGGSRSADSRTLAEHLHRYMDAINFDYIYIENVEEFMSWGPLVPKTVKVKNDCGTFEASVMKYNKKEKAICPVWIPESKTKGRYYIEWLKTICNRGFAHDYKILNCADFGDPTKRFRYFGIFAKHGRKIRFPEPTHSNPKNIKANAFDMFAAQTHWVPVKTCLDLQKTGQSIFKRKKPLASKSLKRIYAGLVKFVMSNDKDVQHKIESAANSFFNDKKDLHIPIVNSNEMPQAFLASYYGSPDLQAAKSKTLSIDEAAPSVTTIPHEAIVFLAKYYGQPNQSANVANIQNPSPTLTTNDRLSLISCQWLVNPQYNNTASSIENPCFTVIARMDKAPPYLATAVSSNNAIQVLESDCYDTILIKITMAYFGLADIKIRMLEVQELKAIQSFPKDYVLIGTQAEQKKFIGNSVPTKTVQSLVGCI